MSHPLPRFRVEDSFTVPLISGDYRLRRDAMPHWVPGWALGHNLWIAVMTITVLFVAWAVWVMVRYEHSDCGRGGKHRRRMLNGALWGSVVLAVVGVFGVNVCHSSMRQDFYIHADVLGRKCWERGYWCRVDGYRIDVRDDMWTNRVTMGKQNDASGAVYCLVTPFTVSGEGNDGVLVMYVEKHGEGFVCQR